MWWEYVIVAGAVTASLAWLVRRVLTKRACAGCGPSVAPGRLQSRIPVLHHDRTP